MQDVFFCRCNTCGRFYTVDDENGKESTDCPSCGPSFVRWVRLSYFLKIGIHTAEGMRAYINNDNNF